MKKTKLRWLVQKTRAVPSVVFIILSVVLNYVFGQIMLKINTLYSEVSAYEQRTEFTIMLMEFVGIWFVLKTFNSLISKIEKNKMLDENYMKWIKKLTTSKLSSISSITTGAASNAISAISMADKQMTTCIFGMIPSIYPFAVLCIREYKVAGVLPPIINIACIMTFIVFNVILARSKVYQRAAKARSELHGVTLDCIVNSRTVKYFMKEDWSINRQDAAQEKSYVDFLALPAIMYARLLDLVMWVPTIANIYLCWGVASDVLFIIMMGYSIDNIAGYIGMFMEAYSDKVSQLKVLGKLEKDDVTKASIGDSIVIKDVTFKYNPDDEDAVLFKVDSLEIRRGHRYCVTGKSGFGKSTLAKIITSTYPVMSGYVPAVDCVYMFAESELFNTSIAENIAFDEDVDRQEVLDMLTAMEIDVDLDPMKDPVGEKGAKLSTGQMQRVNLARTLFYARRHPGALIVMDEVTSALDEATSLACLKYVTEEFKRLGVTLVYISNKPDYRQVDLITDNIYVHRDGKVVTYSTD